MTETQGVFSYAGFSTSPAQWASLAGNWRISPRLALVAEVLRFYCHLNGYTFKITSGFRTDAEQDALYAQGRTKPGDKVTNARAGQSKHNSQGRGHAIAIDIYCTDPKTKRSAAEVTSEVAKVAVAFGCHWGGNWNSAAAKALGDIWHLELP